MSFPVSLGSRPAGLHRLRSQFPMLTRRHSDFTTGASLRCTQGRGGDRGVLRSGRTTCSAGGRQQHRHLVGVDNSKGR